MILYDRGRWLHMVFRTHGSVVKEVMPRVIAVTIVAIAVMLCQERFPVLHRSLTTAPFLLTALPIGIILGFRNSSSYDRFWEARKHWGALVNASRSFTRQLESLIRGGEASAPLRKKMAYRAIAAVHALRITLRGDKQFDDLGPFLPADEVSSLTSEINPPAAILHGLGRDIAFAFEKGWLDAHHATLLEQTVVQFTDVVGACERIKNTPTPVSYVLFIHRAVAFYCFLLPFGVLDTVKSLTPVVVFFVSYALFSLDAIGDELDDPFRRTPNGLPLSTLARNIEIFVRARLGEKDLPAKIQPLDGVVY